MKKRKLMESFSLVDDEYLCEADPSRNAKQVKRKRNMRVWLSIAACFCCAIIGLNLWLFIPLKHDPPNVSKYSDSEYYGIIVKLNELTYRKPSYKNNFERYLSGIFKGATAEDMNMEMAVDTMQETMATGSAKLYAEDGTAEYVETTDNQVVGVIEGDIFKRSSEHIYYLNGNKLEVYSIDKESSSLVGSFEIKGADDMRHMYSEVTMYLSEDCKTVTLMYPYYTKDNRACIAFESLDVSDPAAITLKDRVRVSGTYLSSRLVDGDFLVLSQFYVNYNPDFSDESTFVPQIDKGEGYESIPVGNIISPEKLDSARYTVVCKMDGDTLELYDTSAFLSYSDDVYVSNENIYVTRTYSDRSEDGELVINTKMTDISRMPYAGESFGEVSSVTVDGYVKDQYSMDEYNGYLRVVTTTDVWSEKKQDDYYESRGEILLISRSGDTNADLYVIDFDACDIRAQMKAFAPAGEVVQSVRFDGNTAYVCTSVQLTDPVFFFDLSDLDNITVKDTGTIEGFSTSLVNLKDGFLLGIGIGSDRNTLKIEVYEETENGVASVCKYEVKDAGYSTDYKSYFIDRENGFVGLGITLYGKQKPGDTKMNGRYVLVHFDGYRLRELLNVSLNGNDSSKRGVYIDGYMYMLGSEGLVVEKVN